MARILHRIFFNFNDGPDPFLPFLESWRRELPDFEIKLWDKTNLPLDLNEYTRTLAAEKNHAYLSDYFRCWLLAQYGGVYLDADIEILDGAGFRNIYDEAQKADDYDLFIGVESAVNGKLTAHSMGVKDGAFHPMLRFLMNLYETAFSGPLHYAIKNFDMPYLMSLYFLDKERKEGFTLSKDGRYRDISGALVADRMKIYPPVYFSPLTTRGDRMAVNYFGSETCMCHHFAATWREEFKGLKLAKCFSEALHDGDYVVKPELVSKIKERFPTLGFTPDRPEWTLKPAQIKKLERILNALIPYGSPQYRLLKKK
jgi:hypothetical protein